MSNAISTTAEAASSPGLRETFSTPVAMAWRMAKVVLVDARDRKWLVPAGVGLIEVKGLGKVKTDGLDRLIGRKLAVEGRELLVLRPSVRDLMETIQRKAQIVVPKDAATIAFNCSLQAGDLVVEGGSGSGALTIALAHSIYPDGKVVSYEVRPDFVEVARANVEKTGLQSVVEFKERDIIDGIEEREVKAVVLDLPEPWRALKTAAEALRPGGHLASYSPTVEQVRETVLALRREGFADIWTVEVLERRMEVKRGTRPAFDMLGHTGYTTFARKTLELP